MPPARSLGAALGTSTLTAYIESSAGIAAGARTGLANVFTAALFLLALFFSPLMEMFASAVTVDYTVFFSPEFPAVKHTMSHYPVLAPVLLVVGAYMMSGIKNIKWDDMSEALPAYLAMIIMPLSFSITEGIAFGFISYTVLKVARGKAARLHWIVYAVSALFRHTLRLAGHVGGWAAIDTKKMNDFNGDQIMKTTTFQNYKARQMKEPGVNRAWQELEEEFEMLESILNLREQAGMSQDVLAKKAGISRSVYSRLQRDGFRNASLATLRKIAEALDARLVVHIDHKNSPSCAAKQKRAK